MNIIDQNKPNDDGVEPFDLQERYEQEFQPLVTALCDKALEIGLPIYVLACYKSDENSTWLASSSRSRDGFAPKEFFFIRAMLEGEMMILGEIEAKS